MSESDSVPPADESGERLHGVWLLAHDLKYSVSLLNRSLEDLQRHVVSSEPARRAYGDTSGILAHVSYLSSALLDGLHKQGLQRTAIVLNDFIKDRESAIVRAAGGRIAVSLRLSAAGGVVFASVPELEYLVMTLVGNAVEAMPGGGELTVGTGWLDRVSMPDHSSVQPRRYVRLTVSDTGETADQADQKPHAKLFDATPTDGTTAEIVRESVAAAVWRLNGWLIVEGEPRAGTRVHMCLPAIPDAR